MSISSKSKKNKLIKKKDHERKAKVKVLKKNEVLRKEKKKEKQQIILEIQRDKLVNGKLKPFRKNAEIKEMIDQNKSKTINDQLDHNMKLLEALEQEHQEEQNRRKKLNESLESQGLNDIQDKLDALHMKALEEAGNKEEYLNAISDEFNKKE
jgi:hypothetical protein